MAKVVKADCRVPVQSVPIRRATKLATLIFSFALSWGRVQSEMALGPAGAAVHARKSASITVSVKEVGALGDGQLSTDSTAAMTRGPVGAAKKRWLAKSRKIAPIPSRLREEECSTGCDRGSQ